MKYVTLESGILLAGVANMLSLYGIESTDAVIARGMEAPFLLQQEEHGYSAGKGLFRPRYVNHYLHPIGFHMSEHSLPQGEVGAFLRNRRCALLTLNVAKDTRRMVVFSGYADRKYQFINLKQRFSFEPDTLAIAAASLKARLDETVTVYTLDECAPEAVDFIALLTHAIETLHALRKELLACPARVSQEDFAALDQRLFRPFMQDLLPVISLTEDPMLISKYQLMNYDYRHLLIRDPGHEVRLRGKLPLESALLCLQYLQEDILDRLYVHGADDELLGAYAPIPRD